MLLMLPMWTNLLIRTYSIMAILDDGGILNSLLGTTMHIVGTKGEILGNVHDGRLKMYRYEPVKQIAVDDYVDITVAADEQEAIGGHYGGDYFIMKDLVKFLNGLPTSSSTTVIEDSVNGHLVCYAAEISRKEKRVVDLNEEFGI
jgi:hypothetical protein